jgi:prolyl-tRNA synthetase
MISHFCISLVRGRKTDMEKFAGAAYTTTLEAFVAANGRSVQACTSHSLGQNFAKVFKIQFEDENKSKQLGWQNSWGFSTRSVCNFLITLLTVARLVLPSWFTEMTRV